MGFKIAFCVQGYTSETPGKDDPNYVRWVVQLTQSTGGDGAENATPLKFHKCTDQDYDSFYPPAPSYISNMAVAKK